MAMPDTPTLEQIAATFAGYDANGVPVTLARAMLARLAPAPPPLETVALHAALDRVLGHDVVCEIDVPAHDNAAMDGYALRGCELDPTAPTRLRPAGVALAGAPFDGIVPPGGCVRITTGAVMPDGLDTVVPEELVTRVGDSVLLPVAAVARGDHRRLAGEDLARGDVVLCAGHVLRPADLGLLASLGRADVAVRRRLRVAFFSTGSELRSVGQPLAPGCVYDSNRYTLWGMLQRLGVQPLDLGVVADDPAALAQALRDAARHADVVITTGGVSVGEADHIKGVMARLGEVLFWRLAMRPGRPMAIGRVCTDDRSTLVFGLPGNPVAVMVTFYALVRGALLAIAGASDTPPPMLRVRSAQPLRKRAGRTEYQRGIVTRSPDGHWQVLSTGAQGSGILRSMSQANGLVVLEHDRGDVDAGEWVDVLPFDGLV
jgi:molybdopterin molybdotransferase